MSSRLQISETKPSRSASVSRKFQPHFTGPSVSLPPIKHFQLDYILKHVLKDESQQTVDCLVDVSSRYRKDLKKEIRLKLSIEQRLQNKNIEVAKRAHSIDTGLQNEITSISKTLYQASVSRDPAGATSERSNNLDVEVLQVVQMAEEISPKFFSITKKAAKIDVHLNGSDALTKKGSSQRAKYPLLYQFFHPEIPEVKKDKSAPPQTPSQTPSQNSPPVSAPLSYPRPESNEHHNLNTLPSSEQPITIDDKPMDPKAFDEFMAQTLSNYRNQQSKRYAGTDIFMEEQQRLYDSTELYNGTHFSGSSATSSAFHQYQDPIGLLYVMPSISAKSAATVTENFQTSHFKKLRINGSPITSESFRKRSLVPEDCECKSDRNVFNKPLEATASKSSSASISTEEDVHIEPLIVSDSSDSDSSHDDNAEEPLSVATNEYYSSLHDDYRSKKKKQKRRSLQKRIPSVRAFSPTPKHEPSHHILKPKASILKPSVYKDVSRASKPSKSLQESPDSKVWDRESSPPPRLPIINNDTVNSVNSITALGIIVREDSSDAQSENDRVVEWNGLPEESAVQKNDSIKSLDRLRSLVL
ncbi:hypothetical protein PSN45_002322 [Yamadazyma tenuis]|uniref:Uncharacterized protein n=1 Tax=Candida tenuis (strain ATCC 10573 / BCRC 21748 / CBS 615 / JCM 9827 / NBRC 10315 / NRRL Y-1498 / VKM Y-70) TaxID=590646 RepID=G3BEQ8_CANTC|nr:uncharacterized protein CANTEDRAFT_136459 [Yamadazyma tenuis ATCC 10573]EGV59953.1 hypothetical protein CANTEDRAFT_136459 [Yamadazyma tenuis ATCC 10573]WEJ94822.1 hypothetical protein PSN45_002322 [Yamadazyma tenuis]